MTAARPVLALSTAVLLALSVTGAAANPAPPKPVTMTDPTGDANGINSQGQPALAGKVAAPGTPAQVAGADIVSVSYQTLVSVKVVKGKKVNVPTGIKVVMTLAASPQVNVIFRATPVPAGCTTFSLSWSRLADSSADTSSLRHNCPGFVKALPTDTYEDAEVDSVVASGKTITWTLRAGKALPAAITPGTPFKSLSGHTRFYAGTSLTGGATVPVIDEAAGTGTYTYGR